MKHFFLLENKKFIVVIGFSILIIFVLLNVSVYLLNRKVVDNISTVHQSEDNNINVTAVLNQDNIPDQTVKKYISDNKEGLVIQISSYKNDPSQYPIAIDSVNGNYQYNISFDNDIVNINFSLNSNFYSHSDLTKNTISQLVLAGILQKVELNLSSGSLFDPQIRKNHINYLNKIYNNKEMSNANFVSLKP